MDGLREEMQGHVVMSVVSIMRAVSLLLDGSIGLQFKADLESVKQRRRQTQMELLTGFGPDVQTTFPKSPDKPNRAEFVSVPPQLSNYSNTHKFNK